MRDPIKANQPESSRSDSSEAQTNTPPPVPVEIENAWRECEARLQMLRSDIEKLRTSAAWGVKPGIFPDDTEIQQALELLTGLSKGPSWLIQRGLAETEKEERAKQRSAKETFSETSTVPEAPKRVSLDSPSPINLTNSASPEDNINITSDDAMQQGAGEAQSFAQSGSSPVSSPLIPNDSSSNFLPFANPSPDSSREAQDSSDRLLAALEQNTVMTSSLFNEMLALIDGQNRLLAEVGRKISDLAGQLNSLKNP